MNTYYEDVVRFLILSTTARINYERLNSLRITINVPLISSDDVAKSYKNSVMQSILPTHPLISIFGSRDYYYYFFGATSYYYNYSDSPFSVPSTPPLYSSLPSFAVDTDSSPPFTFSAASTGLTTDGTTFTYAKASLRLIK